MIITPPQIFSVKLTVRKYFSVKFLRMEFGGSRLYVTWMAEAISPFFPKRINAISGAIILQ